MYIKEIILTLESNVLKGPIQLLIIQGSPFCNIDCKYCYLPDRLNKKKISVDTVRKTIERVVEAGIIHKELHLVWHAGEPLVVPLSYYEEVFYVIRSVVPSNIKIFHNFQTNAILINDDWCVFFKKHDVRVGISIDGPEHVNDKNRVDRKGKGTFKKILKGVDLLKKHNVSFHAIAVVSSHSLEYPDEIYDFFFNLGITRLGLNIEETEGTHTDSSINQNSNQEKSVYKFIERFFSLHLNRKGKFIVREYFDAMTKLAFIPYDYYDSVSPKGQQTKPFSIVNVDINGNFSTFSPELLGQVSEQYGGDFIIGNVYKDSFEDALKSTKFQNMYRDILKGIKKCELTCNYFPFCGGGVPSNKYYENGSFDSSETKYCKYAIQIPFDVTLKITENVLNK